mgnify:CR=1 FL=1
MSAFKSHALASLWAHKPALMGVVNVTPDSFSDGGHYFNQDKAIEHALTLIEEGADILDVGGESTRPGAQMVDVDEEIRRIVPVIRAMRGKTQYISIDTKNAKTMVAAIEAGANIINDVSALSADKDSLDVAKEAGIPVVLMHMQGEPSTMQKNPSYQNAVKDVFEYLQQRIDICDTHGIDADLLLADPGIGFGKSVQHNLAILQNIKRFLDLPVPILLGVSRKTFLGKISNDEPPSERVPGSISAALWSYAQGIKIFRVHDVRETRQALKVFEAISSYDNN